MSSIFAMTVRDHETRAERCKCYACVSYDRDGNFIGNRGTIPMHPSDTEADVLADVNARLGKLESELKYADTRYADWKATADMLQAINVEKQERINWLERELERLKKKRGA